MPPKNHRKNVSKRKYSVRSKFIDIVCEQANKELNLPAYFVQRTLYMLAEEYKIKGIERVIEIIKKPDEFV